MWCHIRYDILLQNVSNIKRACQISPVKTFPFHARSPLNHAWLTPASCLTQQPQTVGREHPCVNLRHTFPPSGIALAKSDWTISFRLVQFYFFFLSFG